MPNPQRLTFLVTFAHICVYVCVPQILAAMFVLVLYWNNPGTSACRSAELKFKLWTGFCAFRLFLTTIVTVRRYLFVEVNSPSLICVTVTTHGCIGLWMADPSWELRAILELHESIPLE